MGVSIVIRAKSTEILTAHRVNLDEFFKSLPPTNRLFVIYDVPDDYYTPLPDLVYLFLSKARKLGKLDLRNVLASVSAPVFD